MPSSIHSLHSPTTHVAQNRPSVNSVQCTGTFPTQSPTLLKSQRQEAHLKEASRTFKTSPQSHPWDSQSPHLALNILHANCKGASLCLARAFLEGGPLA